MDQSEFSTKQMSIQKGKLKGQVYKLSILLILKLGSFFSIVKIL